MKSKFLKFIILQRIIRQFPAIQWNRPNVILFNETIRLSFTKALVTELRNNFGICFSFHNAGFELPVCSACWGQYLPCLLIKDCLFVQSKDACSHNRNIPPQIGCSTVEEVCRDYLPSALWNVVHGSPSWGNSSISHFSSIVEPKSGLRISKEFRIRILQVPDPALTCCGSGSSFLGECGSGSSFENESGSGSWIYVKTKILSK
jgi:hypothetical protein